MNCKSVYSRLRCMNTLIHCFPLPIWFNTNLTSVPYIILLGATGSSIYRTTQWHNVTGWSGWSSDISLDHPGQVWGLFQNDKSFKEVCEEVILTAEARAWTQNQIIPNRRVLPHMANLQFCDMPIVQSHATNSQFVFLAIWLRLLCMITKSFPKSHLCGQWDT